MGTLLIGLSALAAHQRAMEVTSHNIANAATPGYSRQRAELGTEIPQSVSPGQVGRGVQVNAITSQRDELIIERLRQADTDQGRLDMLYNALVDTELVFNEPSDNGFSSTIDALFTVFEDLSGNPESTALRGATVQQMETVVANVRDLGAKLEQQRASLLTAAQGEIKEANSLIDQIVSVNENIRREVLVGRNPNDLLDRRDLLARDLASIIDIRTRKDPLDSTMYVEMNGRLIIGSNNGQHLAIETRDDASMAVVLEDTGEAVAVDGGSLAGLVEVSRDVLPQVIEGFDGMVLDLIGQFNAIHATGTNHLFQPNSFVSETVFDQRYTTEALDGTDNILDTQLGVGIAEALQPVYTDADGASIPANLTINVYDPDAGTAEKFVVRYDPGTGALPAGRSLDDLVAAINSGRGGGFSVIPPYAGGVDGVTAELVPVSGGTRLKLQADSGKSLDFSRALDTRPADRAWTGEDVQITGGDVALANARLVFEVAGGQLQAYTHDPEDGVRTAYGSPVALGANGAIGGFAVDFLSGTTWTEGQRFSVDLDQAGNVIGGAHTESARWTAGDAGFTIKGRYDGDHAYDADRPWAMRILQGGEIGSTDNPPIVEFTWYSGAEEVRVAETATYTLDDDFPPGAQVPIGDGVYAVFDQGSLTQAATVLPIVVDGQPDQARLLPALGINAMFSGYSASTMEVSDELQADADRLAVAHTRSAGDNANILDMRAVREAKVFGDNDVGLDDFYQGMVADVAVRIQQAEQLRDNQDVLTLSLENRREEVSGVNIDEEVGMLILQQQAYSAAARLISVAQENIRTLLDVVG